MELFDTHCHLSFEPLCQEVPAILQRSRDAGVKSWITVGTDIKDSEKAVALAEQFENLYAAIGLHPHEAQSLTAEALNRLRQLAENPKVVAIGETGLDFHYNFSKQPDQIRAFVAQLKLAAELNLPVIVHSRNAFEQTMELLQQYGPADRPVVLHCFSGSAEQLRQVLARGYYVSFTGLVTFKNASGVREAARQVPLDRLMLETDCPYMSPEPMRKQKINEPALMVHTARYLAELKAVELEQLAEATTANARSFFGLPT